MKVGRFLELRLYRINLKVFWSWSFINFLIATFFSICAYEIRSPLGFTNVFVIGQITGVLLVSALWIGLDRIDPARFGKRAFVTFITILLSSLIANAAVFQYAENLTGSNHFLSSVSPAALHWIDRIKPYFYNFITEIFICSTIIGFFFYWEKMEYAIISLREQRTRKLTMEKKVVEAQLKILQAQIEPHFLFNTLANILSLFDTDVEIAKAMQTDLITYLETSLTKLRIDSSTIGLEMEMTRSYLNIFKIRMGNRLSYKIEMADSLKSIPYPPMLIQPLVENSIKHGLEPKEEGGDLLIKAHIKNACMLIEISDTGIGFKSDKDPSIGLSNTKDRIKLLYGDKGRLYINENKPSGIRVIIETPL